jgi:hypothetical protein
LNRCQLLDRTDRRALLALVEFLSEEIFKEYLSGIASTGSAPARLVQLLREAIISLAECLGAQCESLFETEAQPTECNSIANFYFASWLYLLAKTERLHPILLTETSAPSSLFATLDGLLVKSFNRLVVRSIIFSTASLSTVLRLLRISSSCECLFSVSLAG